jgi:hypothetical protein
VVPSGYQAVPSGTKWSHPRSALLVHRVRCGQCDFSQISSLLHGPVTDTHSWSAPHSRRGTSGTPPPAPGGWCAWWWCVQRRTCKPRRCRKAQHRVPVLLMRLSTLNQCIASGDPSAAAFAYGNCTYDDGPYVPSPRVTGGLLDGDRQTDAAVKLWRTHCARRLARATRTIGGQARSWCAAARLRTG